MVLPFYVSGLLRRRFNQTTEWSDVALFEAGETTEASAREQVPIQRSLVTGKNSTPI